MHWLRIEYLLKGIYLGLLFYVAMQAPDWVATGKVAACTFGGLVLLLGASAFRKQREGYRVQGRLPAFILYLLLESPALVYAGILLGMAAGAYFAVPLGPENDYWPLTISVGGGALLGVVFGLMHQVRDRRIRLGLGLLLVIVLMAGVLHGFDYFGEIGLPGGQFKFHDPGSWNILGVQLLLGIPIFYLLTFAGREEETEVEIGTMCAALGLGAGMLLRGYPNYQAMAFVIPVMLYFYYINRILPGLKVFKHAARGFSFAKVGRYRQALLSFRRALQLDPQNKLAREGLWDVHRSMDLPELVKDQQTLALVDLDLCLERAGSLLIQAGPTPEKLVEANRLLDLISNQRPAMKPKVCYWRAIALTHSRQFDQAAHELEQVLDPTGYAVHDPERQGVLLQAWQLGLVIHEELRRRVGLHQLGLPHRRMEAIGALELQLRQTGEDADLWNLKRQLYQDVTESEYEGAAAADGVVAFFDHGYVQQLGLALINDNARWQRGGEYLRMAARGLPNLGPSLFIQIAQAHQRNNNIDGAWHNYELAKQAGRAVGPKNLAEEERHAYFATVKMLGEAALERGETEKAIENFQLYVEYERSGVETLRSLAGLSERRGDPLAALRVTEQALVYNGRDKDLLERKDRYYYSVLPDHLLARLETAKHGFDVAYCLQKARTLLEAKNSDLETVEWAQHLALLASIVTPESIAAKVLLARSHLRRGERDQAVPILEQLYSNKPEKFASSEDDDSWSVACRVLGELYLYELGRADLAVGCFNEYRKSSKSGADTLYKLGQAYEQLGDRGRAAKCYEHVTAYEDHPLAPDARDALYRLQTG